MAYLLGASYEDQDIPRMEPAAEGLKEVSSQINDRTDHSNWVYTGGTHEVDPANSSDSSEMYEYMEDAVKNMHDDGKLLDGDHIVLIDRSYRDGYGKVIWGFSYGGNTYHVARCYAGNLVSNQEVRYMAIHEAGHTYQADHEQGSYNWYTDSDGHRVAYQFTPMATPYVFDRMGYNKNCGFQAGTATPPDEFCLGQPNHHLESDSRCEDDYYDAFEECAINEIDNHLDNQE